MAEDGDGPLGPIEPLPIEGLPAHLEAEMAGGGAFGALRAASGAWLRSDPAGEALARALVDLEAPLGRSYLLDQPDVAGMGVGAWGLAVALPATPLADPEAAARRMVGSGPLGGFLGAQEAPPKAEALDDPTAAGRAADLLAAMQRLDAAAGALPEGTPEDVTAGMSALRADLDRRLRREMALTPSVRAALGAGDWTDPGLPSLLRGAVPAAPDAPAAPPARPLPRAPSTTDPYRVALDTALASEPAAASPELDALRARIEATTRKALAAPADSAAGQRAVEQARRLMAQETALTGGALAADASRAAPDTLALRRALLGRPSRTARPQAGADGVEPRAGLPEVPILSSRGERAQVVGYLAAGERAEVLAERGDFVQVRAPGRQRPGWVNRALLAERVRSALGPVAPRPGQATPGLGGLAALVAGQTGASPAALLAEAGKPPLALDKRPARRARGSVASPPAPPAAAPVRIGRVSAQGLDGPDAAEAAQVINLALAALPEVLEARLRADPERVQRLRGRGGEASLRVPLTVPVGRGEPRIRARVLADRLADAVLDADAARIDHLTLGVQIEGTRAAAPEQVFAQLAAGDGDGVDAALADERKSLDAAQRGRLASFFGHDFKDALLFAGPMAGALARSVGAEAFTHGQRVFFDPAHFRLDTARGEALLAHELTHTQQAADRAPQAKEAEAMVREAAYLDWLQPGGAPVVVEELPLDPTTPEAAAAGDVAESGVLRARAGRTTQAAESGPRLDEAKKEERVAQILDSVQTAINGAARWEADRIGRLADRLNRS